MATRGLGDKVNGSLVPAGASAAKPGSVAAKVASNSGREKPVFMV